MMMMMMMMMMTFHRSFLLKKDRVAVEAGANHSDYMLEPRTDKERVDRR